MIYLFSTKAALRKAMVGLSNYTGAYPSSSKTIEAIANYLTDGGLSAMDAKIKAQEEIVLSLERQSKSLAERIEGQEETIQAKVAYRKKVHAEIEASFEELNSVNSNVTTAQEQLASLVAQIGAASEILSEEPVESGALADWVASQDLDQ